MDNQAIIEAIRNSHLAKVQTLFEKCYGTSMHNAHSKADTLFYFAIFYDQIQITAYFIKNGYDPQSKIKTPAGDFLLPIHIANSPEMIDTLIQDKADINATLSDGYTALHKAVAESSEEIVRHLLEKNANPHAHDHAKRTPLHHLIVSKILHYIAYPNQEDDRVTQNTMEIIIILLQYKSEVEDFARPFLTQYLKIQKSYAQDILYRYSNVEKSYHNDNLQDHQKISTMNNIISMVQDVTELLLIPEKALILGI